MSTTMTDRLEDDVKDRLDVLAVETHRSKSFLAAEATDDGFDSLSYQCGFAPTGGDWQPLRLPLTAFRATFRGREVPGAPALDTARTRPGRALPGLFEQPREVASHVAC